jgi:uncharacterized membrane protein
MKREHLDKRAQRAGPAADVPPGWDYNPSTWKQRVPIIVMAGVAFGIAAYLALYQWRLVGDVWEPFFGEGSRVILNSWISELFPIPDAALGALSYLVDAVSGIIGGKRRWQTMPWMVILFGIAVGPLGAVSVLLVIFQPVLFDAWCTLCLVTAVLSVLMIGPAMDEVLASLGGDPRSEIRHSFRGGWSALWRTEQPSGGRPRGRRVPAAGRPPNGRDHQERAASRFALSASGRA